ncbi:MAG: DNA-binding response OmpR family regulator [Paracoccaceae bacterium]|jgi:DNA-binding response OmpR family regulator
MLADQIRLLVSDDTQEFGFLVRDCATRLGWECVLSSDLASFISGVSSNRFDLLCMQMVHPKVDGLGAIHVLGDVGFSGKVLMFNHSTKLYSRVAGNLSDAHGFALTNSRWPLDPVNVEQALVRAIAA